MMQGLEVDLFSNAELVSVPVLPFAQAKSQTRKFLSILFDQF